jgi:hypothetical protein
VLAAADKREQVTFAKKLMKSAASLSDDAALQAFLYDKAFEFAQAEPTGVPTAQEAMEALAAAQPNRRPACDERVLSMLERQYRTATAPAARKAAAEAYLTKVDDVAAAKAQAGDLPGAASLYRKSVPIATVLGPSQRAMVTARAADLDARQVVQLHIGELTKKLAADPRDKKAATELVVAQLVERGDAAAAARWVGAAADPALGRIVKLAAKDVAQLTDTEAADLGDWYRAQSATATQEGKRIATGRARACYARFLEAYAKEDARRLRVKLALDEMGPPPTTNPAGDGKSSPSALTRNGVIDLMALVDPKADPVEGNWSRDGGSLLSDGCRHARVRIPYQPPEEFDLHVEFTRTKGDGRKGDGGGVELLWSSGDQVRWWPIPDTQPDRRYGALLQVRKDGVTLTVDGKIVGQRKVDDLSLIADANNSVGAPAVGVSSSTSPTAFHRIELTEVTGHGQALSHGNINPNNWRIRRFDERKRIWVEAPLNSVTSNVKDGVLEVRNTTNKPIQLHHAFRAEGPLLYNVVFSGGSALSLRPVDGTDSAIQHPIQDTKWHTARFQRTDREIGLFVDDEQAQIIPYNTPKWGPVYVTFELAPQKTVRLRYSVMTIPAGMRPQ